MCLPTYLLVYFYFTGAMTAALWKNKKIKPVYGNFYVKMKRRAFRYQSLTKLIECRFTNCVTNFKTKKCFQVLSITRPQNIKMF